MTVINTNVNALLSQAALKKNEREMTIAMERLSTGKRINSAKDDAAGMAISQRMTSQIRGLDQAVRNAGDAISMVQTADGAVVEISNMLQRMRELAIQALNGSNTNDDMSFLNKEFAQLQLEIERIADNTEWNGMKVLDGTAGANAGNGDIVTFHAGANANQTMTVSFGDFQTGNISVTASSTVNKVVYAASTVHAVSGAADHANNKWTIAGHGFANNDVVTYHKGGGTQPTGMTDGGTYHIVGVSGNDFQVAATSGGSVIALSSVNGHADQWFTKNSISTANHGYTQGQVVTYHNGGGVDIAGLTGGTQYHVIATDANNFQLASSAANATAGTAIALTGTGAAAVAGNNAQWFGKNTINVAAHGHTTGDKVTYRNGGGTSIGGLTDGSTYYVIAADANNFQLASTSDKATAGTAISLTGTGNDAQSFSSGSFGGAVDSTTIKISTTASAADALSVLDTAVGGIDEQRAIYGAVMNRLEYTIDNLRNVSMNQMHSRSRIQDADYAKETSELARTQIIQQAATAMLSQANTLQQTVLQLLQQ